ncbi:tRNA (guanosine(37)-N1)-methyltransferase TrmD [bacterium]|nr:tRNA (guanosine(37)-N1)-methyltransferase TrmD [bacterium]
MRINILTLFPEFFSSPLQQSMIFKAQKVRAVKFNLYNLRDFGLGPRRQVDDRPYGGGAGMVLRVDVLVKALRQIKKDDPQTKFILLTPKGKKLNQKKVISLAKKASITLICGHYEGFDERIREYVDEEISIGDYVLSGGESAALVVVDAVVRLLPGVLEKKEAPQEESFMLCDKKGKPLLEYPHYTRPEVFENKKVPKVLLSGNHRKIKEWRKRHTQRAAKDR